MTRAKKVILALICAAALCCAAIGGVLLARQPAHAAAGDVTALEIVIPDNTRFYVFEDLADVKGKITVNAEIEGGSSRQLDASEYVLSVQGRGDMTEANGQTFGNTAAGTYTLIVEPADGVQAAGDVRGTKAIEVRIDEVIGIEAVYDATAGQTVFPHTPYNELQNYITVSLVYAGGRRLSTNDYVLSGDMIAPAQIEGGGNIYDVELNVTYNGENFAGEEENRKCTVTITGVTSVAPARITLNGNRPTSRSGEAFDEVQGGLTFTVNYTDFGSNSEVHWNAENFQWYYTKYENGVYEVVTDGTKTAFDWETSNGGLERIAFTYTEGGATIPNDSSTGSIIESGGKKYYYVEIQLLKEPYPELDIVTEYGAYSHGNPVADLPYKYDEDGAGQEQIVSLGQQSTIPFNHEIVSITSVMWQASQGNSQDITENAVVLKGGEQTGEVSLTEVGTYTITLTLVNDMYYWSSLGENGDNFITYTVTIIPAELDLGVSFTGKTKNDAGVAKSGWTYGGSVTETANGTLFVGETEVLTVTGNYGDGDVTYHFLNADGGEIGTTIPTNAGNYYVYVSVAASADGRFAASSMKPGDGTSYTEWAVPFIVGKQEVSPYTETTPASDGVQTVFDYKAYEDKALTADENDPDNRYKIVTNAGGTDVGNYDVVLQLDDRNNYRWAGKTADLSGADFDDSDDFAQTTVIFRIVKAENSLTVTISGWTYGDTAAQPAPTVTFGKPSYAYYLASDTGRENEIENIAEAGAGDYVVVATVANTNNYGTYKDGEWVDTVAEAQFTIARQGVDLPSGIQTQRTYDYGNTLTAWNGSSQAYTVSGNEATVTGDYTVTFTLNDNYRWKDDVVGGSGQPASTTAEYSVAWSVAPLAISVPTGSDPDYTYDGSAQEYKFDNWTAGKNNITPISVLVEEGEAVISDAADAAAGTVSLTDAGNYTITLSLTDTTNFVWADGGDAEREFAFTISRKQIAKPAYESAAGVSGNAYTSTYNAAQQSIDITGVDAILSIGGANDSIASRTDTTVTLSAKNVEVSGGNAAAYEVTFSFTDKNNYCWSGTEDDVTDVAFTWTIQKAENPITASSDTYAGWSYGTTPTDVSALEAKAKYDNLTIDHAYYADDDFDETSGKPNSGAAEIEISATTPAGRYVLYLYHEGNDNTFAADKYFAFTVSQATATISAAFADGDTLAWTYRDADSAHVLEVTVTVGDTTWQYWYRGETLQNKTEGSPEALVVQYLDESGNDVTSAVTSDGMYQLPVGGYSVKVTLDTSAVGVSGNFTASEQTVTGISVSPFVVEHPTLSFRTIVYDGKTHIPTINAPEATRGAEWEVQQPSESSARDDYTLTLTLKDSTNFVWSRECYSEGTPGLGGYYEDKLQGASLIMWYRITYAQYSDLNFSIQGWTYGEAGNDPTYTLPSDELDLAVEITWYQDNGNGQPDTDTATSTRPTQAGKYWVSLVAKPQSYEEITGSAAFTIEQRELTDVQWSGLTGSYTGSVRAASVTGVTGLATENGFSDTLQSLGLQLTYSGAAFDGTVYGENSAAPVNAGSYTVTAVLNNANYCFAEGGDTISATYTVSKVMLTVKANDAEVIYGGDAPAYTVTITGFVNGEGEGVLDELPAATSAYTKQTGVGSVTITVSGGSDNNYDFPVYSADNYATLTVEAAGLQGVKIDNLTGENALTYQGAAYDIETVTGATATAVNPGNNAVEWWFSESEITSLPTNETSGIITSLTNVKRKADHSVGTYTIYYYVSAPNHVAQRGSVQIAITPAELTLTAEDASVVYGEDFTADTSINSYTVQIDGSAEDTLLGSDTKESVFGSFVPSYQAYVDEGDTYNAGDGVTESGYIAFDCSTPQLDNYTVTLQSGTFTVSPRAITVTIEDVQQTYGDGAGDYASAYTVAFTQPAAGVSETPIYGNDSVFTLAVYDEEGSKIVPDNKTDVGVYYIVGSSSNDNYAVTFRGSLSYDGTNNAGKYEIVARVLGNLDWTDPDSLVYDGKQKAFTATGKYGEGENAEEVSFTITYQRQTGEGAYGEETSDAPVNVGSYRVIARSNDPNFTQGLESTRTFTITPYTVTIDWNEEIKLVYNGEEQSGKVSATYQPVAGDAIALAVTPDAEMKDAAEYTLTASFAEDDNALGNYALPGVVTKKYTISPRRIVVTIEDQTSEYGDDLQTLTATETLGTVTGWTDDGKGAIVPGDAKPYDLYIQDYTGGHLAVGSHNIFGSDEEEGSAIDANYDVTFRGTGSANHGVYTVSSRAVTISFAEDTYPATYGTQFDFDATADAVIFARGTAGTSGDAFASGESFESVLNGTAFAVGAKDYGVTSAAGSAFTMQMTLGSTTAGILSVGNYTFTFTDAATLTVGQRAITVTIADKTDIVYGTDAVANTQLTATAALASGSGEAIVNGDTDVYSLAVYDADKNKVTRGTTTPAGEYFIVGKAENNNYAITFIGSQDYDGTDDAGLFEIIISAEGIRVTITNDGATVTYTGSPYYLLDEEEGTYGTLGDLANTLGLGAYAVNADWTDGNPFLWKFRLNDEDGDAITSLTDVKDDAGSAYTVWYKVYLPDVPSYAAKTGTFTVTIQQAENTWTQHYSHGGWAYKGTEGSGSINLAFDGLETGSRFTPATSEFGTVSCTYYGTRSGSGTEDDPYVYGDEKAKDFFNNDTPAGTYYVKVEVAGTKNYTALTDHHLLVVSKHVLTVGWEERNVSLGTTQNTLTGYDTALMSLNDYSSELTLGVESSQDKTLQVTFADTISGTFYVTLALSDGANYAWMNPLSSNEELCRVSFSVALANNEVTRYAPLPSPS